MCVCVSEREREREEYFKTSNKVEQSEQVRWRKHQSVNDKFLYG